MWHELGISAGTCLIILIALYFVINRAVRNGIEESQAELRKAVRKGIEDYYNHKGDDDDEE